MVQISAVIITLNEEANINRCLQSLQGVADEIVILDSLSTDRTREICKGFNVKFIEQPFLGYIEQKNKALECLPITGYFHLMLMRLYQRS